MAHVDLRGRGRPRVSRYVVDVKAIERVGVAAMRRAMRAGQIVVVDEIDKMELFCGPFKDAVLQAVGGPYIVVATVMAKPNGPLQRRKRRVSAILIMALTWVCSSPQMTFLLSGEAK